MQIAKGTEERSEMQIEDFKVSFLELSAILGAEDTPATWRLRVHLLHGANHHEYDPKL